MPRPVAAAVAAPAQPTAAVAATEPTTDTPADAPSTVAPSTGTAAVAATAVRPAARMVPHQRDVRRGDVLPFAGRPSVRVGDRSRVPSVCGGEPDALLGDHVRKHQHVWGVYERLLHRTRRHGDARGNRAGGLYVSRAARRPSAHLLADRPGQPGPGARVSLRPPGASVPHQPATESAPTALSAVPTESTDTTAVPAELPAGTSAANPAVAAAAPTLTTGSSKGAAVQRGEHTGLHRGHHNYALLA